LDLRGKGRTERRKGEGRGRKIIGKGEGMRQGKGMER